jgi:hypothetical protein
VDACDDANEPTTQRHRFRARPFHVVELPPSFAAAQCTLLNANNLVVSELRKEALDVNDY